MDKQRFALASKKVISGNKNRSGIGTLSEKTLHAVLKQYFEPNADKQEIKVGSFVADIAGEYGIIEIQTQNFDKLRKKLGAFLEKTSVTVVYPVPHIKWLYWIDEETGVVSDKRKSPKKGMPYEVFYELYKIKPLLPHPNLKLRIVMLDMEEYRYLNGWSKDKKRGSSRCDRIPLELVDEIAIEYAEDYQKLIPDSLPQKFTSRDYKRASRLTLPKAQKALNVLFSVGAVVKTGKSGNTILYERNDSE